MVKLLSTAEVVLADRISPPLSYMFRHLVRTCRLLCRSRAISQVELRTVENGQQNFCHDYYAFVYGGDEAMLAPVWPTIAAVLDIVPSTLSCGPIWTYWEFGTDRLIGTLPKLVVSRSNPYASLVYYSSPKYQAELICATGQTYIPAFLSEANGILSATKGAGKAALPKGDRADITLLPPCSKPAALSVEESDAMPTVFVGEGVTPAPDEVRAMKYSHARVENGVVSGSKTAPLDEASEHRRRNFVLVRSTDRVHAGAGVVEDVRVAAHGVVLHYDYFIAGGTSMAFTYGESIRSSRERPRQYGVQELSCGLPPFGSLGGRRRFLRVGAIDAVVGTLELRGKDHILFPREQLSGL